MEKKERQDSERRSHARHKVGMTVYYHALGVVENLNIAHTQDSSIGGFLLTTEKMIPPGTSLVLKVHAVNLIAMVVDSRQSLDGYKFDTRLKFLALDEEHRKMISQITDYYLGKGKER